LNIWLQNSIQLISVHLLLLCASVISQVTGNGHFAGATLVYILNFFLKQLSGISSTGFYGTNTLSVSQAIVSKQWKKHIRDTGSAIKNLLQQPNSML